MNNLFEDVADGCVFEEFEYRLLYLRTTPYAEERLAVGLVADRQGTLEARFLATVSVLDLMRQILGDSAVEQFQFAAAEVRRALAASNNGLDDLELPTDLFVAGEKLPVHTQDRDGLLSNVLATASCLVRAGTLKSADPLAPPSQLQRDLFDKVSRLNPLVGQRIFNNKFTANTGQVVNLPILGDRIFGAPVSFAAKEQMMKAESYVAKFNWLRRQMKQEPRIYLLAPTGTDGDLPSRLDTSIRELRAVAEASSVPLKIADSTEVMASQILSDEGTGAARLRTSEQALLKGT
jgi:hypothetical protein